MLWVVAVAVTYAGPYVSGVAGFTVRPGHLAERHGLIVIIALGESVVAIGAGGDDITVDWALAGSALIVMGLIVELVGLLLRPGGRGRRGRAGGQRRAWTGPGWPATSTATCTSRWCWAWCSPRSGSTRRCSTRASCSTGVFALHLRRGVVLYLGGLAAIRLRRGSSPGSPCLVALAVAAVMMPVGGEIDALATAAILAASVLGVAFAEPRSGVLESSA